MKISKTLLLTAFGLLVIPLAAHAADRKKGESGRAKEKPAAVTVQQPVVTAPQSKPTQTAPAETTPSQTATAVTSPQSGEQIKWQVVAGGGGASSSTNFRMSATLGQAATGRATSASYKVNQGFWQEFGPPGCCIGTRGNVNKSVSETPDLSDLSLIISYLTITPKPLLPCIEEANVNGSSAPTPDLSDLSLLISYLTITPKPILPNCS